MLRGMVAARRADHPDDHPQVPRGDGLRRRGHGPAPRQARGAGPRQGAHARRHGAHDDRRRGADGAAARAPASSGRRGSTSRSSTRSTTPASRRCATCRCRSAAARSSASPASRATASGSSSRCSPASATAESGEHRSAGRALSRHPRGDAATTSCRVLPEEPLKNACVAAHDRRREPGVPRLRPRAVRVRRLVAQPQRLPRAGAAQDRALQDQDPLGRDTPIGELSGGNVQRAVLARELAATSTS